MKFDYREIANGFLTELSYKNQKTSSEDVVENEARIIQYLNEDKNLTTKDLAVKTGLSERTIQRYIKSLRDKGIIRHSGPDKGGYWEILTPSVP